MKQRSKEDRLTSTAPPGSFPSEDRKENLYDILLENLEDTDSEYIAKLCRKQEAKTNKKKEGQKLSKRQLEEVTNRSKNSHRRSTGGNFGSGHKQALKKITSDVFKKKKS